MLLCVGYQRVCDQTRECDYVTVNCPAFETCEIICSALSEACTQMVIYCPSGYPCSLTCSGMDSCQLSILVSI